MFWKKVTCAGHWYRLADEKERIERYIMRFSGMEHHSTADLAASLPMVGSTFDRTVSRVELLVGIFELEIDRITRLNAAITR